MSIQATALAADPPALTPADLLGADLLEKVRKATEGSIQKGTISRSEARLLLEHYERGLSSYTYLTEDSAMPFYPQNRELNNGAAANGEEPR